MKKLIGLAIVALSFVCANVQAQTSVGAQSQVSSTGQAQSTGGVAALDYAPVSNYAGSDQKRTSASAVSGELVAGFNTCLGSVVGAVQTVAVGVSLGKTTQDDPCNLRSDSGQLFQMHLTGAAFALLCTKPENEYAIDISGGIPVLRDDGAVVHRRCPMSMPDWVAAGKPMLDPITGQPPVEPVIKAKATPVDPAVALIEQNAARIARSQDQIVSSK